MKKLEDFSQFIVSSVQVNDDEVKLSGTFKDSKGVSERRSWLVRGQEYYIGDLIEFNTDNKTAIFVNWDEKSKNVKEGDTFFWIDGYWNLNLIYRILNKEKLWVKERFKPQNAQSFIQNGVKGWCKVGQKIPEGAKIGDIILGGWDHEHCSICNAKIGSGGERDCYRDEDMFWLCVSCFDKYASRNDLSFTNEI